MLTFSRLLSKHSKTCGILPVLRFSNFSSSSTTLELKNIHSSQVEHEVEVLPNSMSKPIPYPKSQSPMVAAAFASLSNETGGEIQTPMTDEKLNKATTVEEVLTISEGNGISRRHALKVVSILADWCIIGKIQLAAFESDPRFIRLCKVLTKGVAQQNFKNVKNSVSSRSEDLTTILSVTADDEAAKLVSSITLSQMVKVMSTLALKKRRSTLLLRTLSFNITRTTEHLNLKQCSDLLYSMSMLNFMDENLLSKVSNDICLTLDGDFKKSSVVGSILTSMGLLKYKNPAVLDSLSDWVLNNHADCRPQDIYSLFMTLAVLNYIPSSSEKLFDTLIPQINPLEAGKPLNWLEIVWSLVLLNRATSDHIASVLNETFWSQIGDNSSTSTKLKLLNIDGAAQYLLNDYAGPRIPPSSDIRDAKIAQTKEKSEMADAIIDGLKSLIQSEHCLRTRINTGLGFFIDAECALDNKCSPLTLNEVPENKEAKRIAILAYEYHDMCRGKFEPTGLNVLISSLLRAQGYQVLAVPYTDFRTKDKLVLRVQYLESKLKEIVKNL